MRTRLLSLALVTATACAPKPAACPTPPAPTVVAAPPVTTPTPEPATRPASLPEMQAMAYFLGTWTCDVESFGFKVIPGGKYVSTIKDEAIMGGRWHEIHNESGRASIAALEGWDATAHHYMRFGVDSRGNQETKTSDGWKGDDMLYVGSFTLFGHEYPEHHTLTKKGDHEFLGKTEIQAEDGKWTLLRTEDCKK